MNEHDLQGSALVPALERAALLRQFCSSGQTIANVRRDFPEWHKGRARYLLWAIDVDRTAVRAQLASASAHLADLLLGNYRRQPHITLALCGFSCSAPQCDDDVGLAQIDAQIAALRLVHPRSFAIDIGSLSSFSSAPFLHVAAAGDEIAALRACLVTALDHRPDEYTAHVTVGLYQDAWPSAPVGLRLAAFTAAPATRCIVDRISLMSYAAVDIAGPLTTHAVYHFDSGAIEWHQPSLF
jgi:2'-5' RNA ligase